MIYSSQHLCSTDLKLASRSDLELVRPMVHSDLSEVIEIESRVTRHPWNQNSFSECLDAGYKCWVIESQHQIIAYLVQSIYTEESHILNLVVSNAWQGQGLGRSFVRKACTDAAKSGMKKILLEVRLNNLIAQQLYESEGFLISGRRHNYYRSWEGVEDALVMVRDLEPTCVITT